MVARNMINGREGNRMEWMDGSHLQRRCLEIVLGMDMYDTCLFCSSLMHMIPEWAHGSTLEYYVLSTFWRYESVL